MAADDSYSTNEDTAITIAGPGVLGNDSDPDNALDVVTTGKADMISQGRQQIADPDWANKVKEGKIDEVIRCTRCNLGCATRFPLGLPRWDMRINLPPFSTIY